MGELGRVILELLDRTWAELDHLEQGRFDAWLGERCKDPQCACCARRTTRGVDLYTLLRFDRRKRRGSSTSQTLSAQRELAEPAELQQLRDRVVDLEAHLRRAEIKIANYER